MSRSESMFLCGNHALFCVKDCIYPADFLIDLALLSDIPNGLQQYMNAGRISN